MYVGGMCAAPSRGRNPQLALSLRLLRAEVNTLWPGRSKRRDGWLGDAAHQARRSDHNPDSMGIVHALDLTVPGCRPRRLVAAVIEHPAAHYVIFDGKIWSSSYDWEPTKYRGPNPHTDHVHVSIKHDAEARRCLLRWLLTSS